MKVIIESKGRKFKLYVPMFILTSGIRLTKFIDKKYSTDDESDKSIKNSIKYIDYIDINIIIDTIKELKNYKGLTLVEVRASDGTYVLIKV